MNGCRRTVAAVGLAFTGLAGALDLGCGGSREPAPASAPAPQAQAAAPVPGRAPEANPLPLVDSKGNELTWTAPTGWVSEPPTSPMRKAQYSLPKAPGDPEDGQCAVFYFGAGQGGEVQANIERWAGQFDDGKGGHPSPSVTEATQAGRKVLKVTTEGTYNPSAMSGGDTRPRPETVLLGAIVEGPDANWFFKCTGPRKTMAAHRAEFDALIASVRAP
jgi:hypothetical protein